MSVNRVLFEQDTANKYDLNGISIKRKGFLMRKGIEKNRKQQSKIRYQTNIQALKYKQDLPKS